MPGMPAKRQNLVAGFDAPYLYGVVPASTDYSLTVRMKCSAADDVIMAEKHELLLPASRVPDANSAIIASTQNARLVCTVTNTGHTTHVAPKGKNGGSGLRIPNPDCFVLASAHNSLSVAAESDTR